MTSKEQKLLQDFERHCEHILHSTSTRVIAEESVADKEVRKTKLLKSYKRFFEYYFPHYCDDGKTPCAPFHHGSAHELRACRVINQFRIWHRGAAKSVHSDVGNPIWLLLQEDLHFMTLMGYNEPKAFRLIGDIQAELQHNQLLQADWGEQFYFGDWSDGNFRTKSGARFVALSFLQDPSGFRDGPHRVDLAVIDDVDNLKKFRNRTILREAVENITSNLREAMTKDTQRMVIAQNRKVNGGLLDALVAELKDQPATKVWVVNAIDKHGNPTWDRYTRAYWEEKQENTTIRTFEREYMNNPIEDGNIFKAEWIQWKKTLPWNQYEQIVLYCDLSYEAQGDFKAIIVTGRTGREFHVLDCFLAQCTIGVAVQHVYGLWDSRLKDMWNARLYYEGNATQARIFREEFDKEGDQRGYYVPIVADMRAKGNKFDRIEKMSAHFERMEVWFNQDGQGHSHWKELLSQLLAFERGSGAHDDGPDALNDCIWHLSRSNGDKSLPYTVKSRKKSRRRV